MTMAKAMTGSFYLTETVQIPPGTASGDRVQGSIDLGAYTNVATGQAVAIEACDLIFQVGSDYGSDAFNILQGNGAVTAQLTDLNPGTAFVRADDQSLVASGSINIDQANNIATQVTDLFPDQWGPASLAHAFMVVNDSMYFVVGPDGALSNATTIIYVTVRIRCQIAKLSSKDWISIAIQSTASDN
jgi:hypothetical protein